MRVLVNRLACTESKTGVGHYTAQLVDALRRLPGVATEVFPEPWLYGLLLVARRLLRRLEAPAGAPSAAAATSAPGAPSLRQRLGRWARGLGRRVVSGQGMYGENFLSGRFRALARRCDLYHEPNYLPLPCDAPTLITVHDLSVLRYPQWHPADRVKNFELRFREGLARCEHVLTDAEYVRQEVIHTLGVAPQRVTATPLGVRAGLGPLPPDEVRRRLRRLGLPERYLLCVGTLEPRKNQLMLLRLYCSLPAAVRQRYPLLLVGGWGWNTGELAAYLDGEARHRGVLHLGYLADEHLAALYNGARALLFPSFYEGFGLPPLEMLACGGAVLASTAGTVVETVGGQAHLLDPLDADGWRQALLRITEDDDWWRLLRNGSEAAAREYTWERCAAATAAVYRRVLGGHLRASRAA